MSEQKKAPDRPDEHVLDNSDPTGIGPPPPGAATHVKDGRGVTEAPPVGREDGETPAG